MIKMDDTEKEKLVANTAKLKYQENKIIEEIKTKIDKISEFLGFWNDSGVWGSSGETGDFEYDKLMDEYNNEIFKLQFLNNRKIKLVNIIQWINTLKYVYGLKLNYFDYNENKNCGIRG